LNNSNKVVKVDKKSWKKQGRFCVSSIQDQHRVKWRKQSSVPSKVIISSQFDSQVPGRQKPKNKMQKNRAKSSILFMIHNSDCLLFPCTVMSQLCHEKFRHGHLASLPKRNSYLFTSIQYVILCITKFRIMSKNIFNINILKQILACLLGMYFNLQFILIQSF
jgi:hypothetical protein